MVLLLAILRLLVKIGMEISSFILGALMLIVFGCISLFSVTMKKYMTADITPQSSPHVLPLLTAILPFTRTIPLTV